MIDLQKLVKLQQANTTESIAYFSTRANREVYIYSAEHSGYWGPDASGYYGLDGAGIYTLEDALKCTSHCGPEKKIFIEFKTRI